jgi:mono/diheme cytochrome c family protein
MNNWREMVIGASFIALVGLMLFPGVSFANESPHAKEILKQTCGTCHRMEGKPDPHPNLKGPDLSWSDGRFRLEDSCWQSRKKTAKAPDEFLVRTNPIPETPEMIQAGKILFLKTAKPASCAVCHGENGDGKSKMGTASVPPPRDFTCHSMMKDIPDGQLFWILKNGSHGTPMISFSGLPDVETWQLIHYIRTLAR